MDLAYFYFPNLTTSNNFDINQYTTLERHVTDSNALLMLIVNNNTALTTWKDTFVTSQCNVDTVQNARIAACEGRFGDDDSAKWTDFIGPIGDVVGDFGSEIFRHWLDQTNVKDKLIDLVDNFLKPELLQDTDGDGNVDAPSVKGDFRFLANNIFACDRSTTGTTGYGNAFQATDWSFPASARICVVPSTEVAYHADYATAWASSMNSTKKIPIVNFGTLSMTMSNMTALNQLSAYNVTASNCTVTNAVATNSIATSNTVTSQIAGTSRVTSLFANMCALSNVTANSVNVAGNASVDASGNIAGFSLNINGNNLKILSTGELIVNNVLNIKSTGDVIVNGIKVIDGFNGRCVVYDDQVIPRSERLRLVDVLSGNIGSTDITDLGDPFLSMTPSTANNPVFANGISDTLYRFGSSAWSV